MSTHTFLVMGATGKTGQYTVQHLLARGHAVRAMVHKEDERSEALRGTGAEVVSYQPLSIPRYRERLEKAGLPEFMIQHFCAVALDYQNGIFSGEDKIIAKLTGKPPMTVRDFVASHREAFKTLSTAG
jgi:nucleoside-diphosphate-sugar epimerase